VLRVHVRVLVGDARLDDLARDGAQLLLARRARGRRQARDQQAVVDLKVRGQRAAD
jgi:hypothetical protein